MDKLPEVKLGQAVLIDWADSKSAMGWTYNPDRRRTPGYIRSVGYVVQQNEECTTITTSLDERGASIDDFSIPNGCIRRLERLPSDFDLHGPDAEGL